MSKYSITNEHQERCIDDPMVHTQRPFPDILEAHCYFVLASELILMRTHTAESVNNN